MIDPVNGLPAVLTTGSVSALVSFLLSFLSPLIVKLPGFGANDSTRTVLMRVLVYVCTLAGLVGIAWLQNLVLPRSEWLNLLLYAAGGGTFAHFVYAFAKSSSGSASSGSSVDSMAVTQALAKAEQLAQQAQAMLGSSKPAT